MGNLRIPNESWVLVCDGQKALLLRNEGDAELLNLKPIEIHSEPHLRTAELGTDAPGRSFQSNGDGSRSAYEATDFHAQEEAQFLQKITRIIDAAASERKFKHLVLVAPPHTLGLVRQSLTPAARALILAEVHKDLTNVPIGTIEEHLASA
ncbi:MAG: host attachment protein [Methylovirgula sp.]|uniref:host attachment protein n=1 Tax=Methylovirgula sp. TaxID=1978224 RepID=UPI0030763BDD